MYPVIRTAERQLPPAYHLNTVTGKHSARL